MRIFEFCTQCPDCSSNLIQDHARGEFICENCGYVVMDQIEYSGPESNSTDFEERSKLMRASGTTSVSLHDYGLRTEIAMGLKDYNGKSINGVMMERMNCMRRWHSRLRVSSSKERRLSNILSKINELCSTLSLPRNISETAAIYYRNFDSISNLKGKSISCMASAAVYIACRKCGVARSMDEIVQSAGISTKDRAGLKLAFKYYRMMILEMGSYNNEYETQNLGFASQQYFAFVSSDLHAMGVDHHISKLANIAKIDTRIERLAIDIFQKTNDHTLADGKTPTGIAAAYLYISSILYGINVLQRDISSIAGVTEVTIRNRCKDIFNTFKLEIRVKPVASHFGK